MSIVCRKCGGFGFFLQNRGMQVGMYCDNCGSWLKWVGKKDLDLYHRKGIRIFSQNETVALKQNKSLGVEIAEAMPEPSNFTPIASNFGMNPAELKPESVETNPAFFNIDAEVERRVAEKLKEMEKKEDFSKRIVTETEKDEKVGFCPVCDGNPLESEGNSRVEVSIFSGVMTITDPDGLNIYGLYKLKRCPYCGKLF